jgi:general secretion pathway protein D
MKLLSNIQTINKNDNQDVGIALESENSLNLWNEVEENLIFILERDKTRYSINKQAGLILVTATQAEHERIAQFLSLVHRRITAQVLIEARIVEVVLNKKYKNGIDWDLIGSMKILSDDNNTDKFSAFESLARGMNFLSNFGDTRTLSNPRAVVLNNQHAVFKVVKHNVYYKINSNSILIDKLKPHKTDQHNYGTTVNSTANIVQTGIIFVVHASIDPGDDAVTLWIKPIISRSDKIAEDPAISILGGKTKDDSGMPIISEKSIDTVVRLRDGEVAIIGGLTEADTNVGKFGFTGGRLVAHSTHGEKKEMVMVVKAKHIKNEIQENIPLKDIGIKDIDK